MAICQYCGNEFVPSKYAGGRQRFCSKKCKDKWDYENPKYPPVVCKYCGKKFIPKEANRTTYCSRECAFAAKAKKCRTCGKVITGSQSDYCSDECKEKANNREIKCIVCGKLFRGKTGAKYCSDECRKEKERQRAREKYHLYEVEISTRGLPIVTTFHSKTARPLVCEKMSPMMLKGGERIASKRGNI
ncbi:hypothetical protein E306M_06460 [Moorella sp. E306M]|nr:hypothetical protein E306M_06460 [Moorella sp. E306M]